MSFEGYEEFICINGHYHEVSTNHAYFHGYTNFGNPSLCPFCKAQPKFNHTRDVTNGCGEDHPESLHAEKEVIGFDDEPKIDHHGNKYFIKHDKYKPTVILGEWRIGCNGWIEFKEEPTEG